MALAPLFIAASTRAIAQPYPAKPVRVIVPYAPGGGVDIMARIAAQRLGERMGVQFVVEPRWGRNRDRHRNRRAGAGEVKERIIALGNEPAGGTAEQFGERIRKEVVLWKTLFAELKAKQRL